MKEGKNLHTVFLGIAILGILMNLNFLQFFSFNYNTFQTHLFTILHSFNKLDIKNDSWYSILGEVGHYIFNNKYFLIMVLSVFFIAALFFYKTKNKTVTIILKIGTVLICLKSIFSILAYFSSLFFYMFRNSDYIEQYGTYFFSSLVYVSAINIFLIILSTKYFQYLKNIENEQTNSVLKEELQDSIFSNLNPNKIFESPIKPKTRFFHYLMDLFFIFFYSSFFYSFISSNFGSGYDNGRGEIVKYLAQILGLLFYYFVCEKIFGVTIGKIILQNKVVSENGGKATWQQIVKRTFSRIVPFEMFSAFGNAPWHDSWSNTIIVKDDYEKGNVIKQTTYQELINIE